MSKLQLLKLWKNLVKSQKGVASVVRKKAKINVSRIHKIESEVKHDVIAFLTSVTEKAGIKARYLHQGMTSSDVLDTSF
jgi:adenylosuccinate lyase